MNTMRYKGYAARIDYSEEDGCFVGRLAGIKDIVGFDATTVDGLQRAFHASVDDYLDACKKLGQSPNRTASGRILLRLPPELHADAIRAAALAGESLNQWAIEALRRAV